MSEPVVWEYSWDNLVSYCIDLHGKISRDSFNPEIIVAVSRGGYFTGLILSHMFLVRNLVSVNAITNMNDSVRSDRRKPIVNDSLSNFNMEICKGKKVLVVDDVVNTGGTLNAVRDYFCAKCSDVQIKTAAMIFDTYGLSVRQINNCAADYYSDERCAWASFPWERVSVDEKLEKDLGGVIND